MVKALVGGQPIQGRAGSSSDCWRAGDAPRAPDQLTNLDEAPVGIAHVAVISAPRSIVGSRIRAPQALYC